jgi:uncharacterized protein (TIGR00299 family) protein
MRIAYIDCFSGISGDMFLAALVDASVCPSVLEGTVDNLNRVAHLDARLEISRVDRSGISATKVDVLIGGKKDAPRESRSHSHSHGGTHAQEHGHGHDHQHSHDHSHSSDHAHRGLKEIRHIIHHAEISATAKQRALAIFEALGAAEAKIHNIDIEQVHFHEVGAADAIVDIVCAAVGSEALGVQEWICSPLNVGSGSIECAHGRFPIPAPATAELLIGAPTFSSGIEAELVTPTGAAIVKSLASRFAPLPGMKISTIGYGAGTRDFHGHANVTRIFIGDSSAAEKRLDHEDELAGIAAPQETISVLEASIDDLNPQITGYILERALAEGALDAYLLPAQMKKQRPGVLLTILARREDAARLAGLVLRESSSLGLRMREEKRIALARRFESVETPWGSVRVKIASLGGDVTHYAPEFDDCRRIAQQQQIPLKQVIEAALNSFAERTLARTTHA